MENNNQPTEAEKIEYLKQWYWTSEPHPAGFDVWSHNRFPNKKYKLDRAFEVMKANEPSIEPVFTAHLDNPEEMQKLKDFTKELVDPEYGTKKALARLIGGGPEEIGDIDQYIR